jgi:hypothetical protein
MGREDAMRYPISDMDIRDIFDESGNLEGRLKIMDPVNGYDDPYIYRVR